MDKLIGRVILNVLADFFLICASMLAGFSLLIKYNSLKSYLDLVTLSILIVGALFVAGCCKVGSEIITRKNVK